MSIAAPSSSQLAKSARPAAAASDDDLARRFLDACATIERCLKARYNLGSAHGLGNVLGDIGSRDKVVNQYQHALRAFVQLRNALAHSANEGGRPIANPLPATVEQIERIARQIDSPTPVRSLASPVTSTVSRTDALAPTLISMVEQGFSQVLVVDEGRDVTVLTTNTVARWMAAHLEPDGSLVVEGASVGEVLAHAEPERVVALRPTATVAEAIELFGNAVPPRAIVVTPSGKRTEKPTGIIVVDDLPRLHDVFSMT